MMISNANFCIPSVDSVLSTTIQSINGDELDINNRLILHYGLPIGKVTALIGEDGTYKSRLGRSFLAGSFLEHFISNDNIGYSILITTSSMKKSELWNLIVKHLVYACKQYDIYKDRINACNNFPFHVDISEWYKKVNSLYSHIICRPLDIRDLHSSAFIHIVESALEKAKETLDGDKYKWGERSKNCNHIRLVIDNWNILRNIYPDLKEDSLLLPFLVRYLEHEGINTLIIHSQNGNHYQTLPKEEAQDLREITHNHIYTWNMNCFSQKSVAITTIPPVTNAGYPIIKELKPGIDFPEECLGVDPRFEVFDHPGDLSEPTNFIPLEINIHGEFNESDKTILEYNQQVKSNIQSLLPPINSKQDINSIIDTKINHENISDIYDFGNSYYNLRNKCINQSNISLNKSVINQTDEYWFMDTKLNKSIFKSKNESNILKESDIFKSSRYNLDSNEEVNDNRIPYFWDFGFILFNNSIINNITNNEIKSNVKETLSTLNNKNRNKIISWEEFFNTCKLTDINKSKLPIQKYIFGVNMTSPESYSCLVFEIWFSEIVNVMIKYQDAITKTTISKSHLSNTTKTNIDKITLSNYGSFKKIINKRMHAIQLISASPLLKKSERVMPIKFQELLKEYICELFQTLSLLESILSRNNPDPIYSGFKVDSDLKDAIAIRHWYSTATKYQENHDDTYISIRLPGYFSVRGDWYLGIAKGNRSDYLALKALEALTNVDLNYIRLQSSIGLPVSEKQYGNIKTSLKTNNGVYATYDTIKKLGADKNINQTQQNEFRWLYRSNIKNYDIVNELWIRFLSKCRREIFNDVHITGTKTYDEFKSIIDSNDIENVKYLAKYDNPKFALFQEAVNELVNDMNILVDNQI